MYDYGKCDVCDTPMVEKIIRQDFWLKDRLIVVEEIPAGVCPQCGEKIVNAEVGEQIAGLIGDADRINKAPTISVPLVRYEESMAV